MALFQAVQQVAVLPRRRAAMRQRARRGANRVGLVLAGILVAFLLGLFYLTQTIGTATAGYHADRLAVQATALQRQLSTQQGEIAAAGSEQNVLLAAQASGLVNLSVGQVVRVPGR
jgi:hypothetical protein